MLRLLKKVNIKGSMVIPKKFIEKFGKYYYMEIYEDKIILIPAEDEE